MDDGGSAKVRRHRYTMELNYGLQLNPAIRPNPNLQYIINPGQQAYPFRTADIGNAPVLGFRFTIDAPNLIDLALGPR